MGLVCMHIIIQGVTLLFGVFAGCILGSRWFVLDSTKWVRVEGQARAWVTVGQISPERRFDDQANRGHYEESKSSIRHT